MPVYTQSPSLNDNAYDLPNQDWTAVGREFTVTKKFDNTPIELEYSGRAQVESMSGYGVWFQIRLNNEVPTYFSLGSLISTELQGEISTKSIYLDLPAGTYTGRIYAQSPNPGSSAKGIMIDPGGWDETVLITEFET